MTETEQSHIELARQLVASPHWRWLPGMLAAREGRVDARSLDIEAWIYDGDVPALGDPLTCLAVLLLVRDAWTEHWAQVPGHAAPIVTTERVDEGWRWRLSSLRTGCGGVPDSVGTSRLGRCVGSEVEALVDALLAAPAR